MGGKDTGIGPVEADLAQPGCTADQPESTSELKTAGDTAESQQTREPQTRSISDARGTLGPAQSVEDGKKRKVALHVAYIGAGYAVCSLPSHSAFALALAVFLELHISTQFDDHDSFNHEMYSPGSNTTHIESFLILVNGLQKVE